MDSGATTPSGRCCGVLAALQHVHRANQDSRWRRQVGEVETSDGGTRSVHYGRQGWQPDERGGSRSALDPTGERFRRIAEPAIGQNFDCE